MDVNTNNELISKVVNLYSDVIIRIAFQYTKNRADAEDIMQDVFISFIKQPPFDNEQYLKAWLIRVAINKSKDYLRAAKRRNTLPLDIFENTLTEKQKFVLDELEELSALDRIIIFLFYYERYTAKEIAKIMDKKEKAILMRLSRAREKLKHLLEEKK